MPRKKCFFHLRYLNGFILRVGLLLFLEYFQSFENNFYLNKEYAQINQAAENICDLDNPYEKTNYRNSPILAFLFILNLLFHRNFIKFVFISLDLINSALIEILLNLQQKKYCQDRTKYNDKIRVFSNLYDHSAKVSSDKKQWWSERKSYLTSTPEENNAMVKFERKGSDDCIANDQIKSIINVNNILETSNDVNKKYMINNIIESVSIPNSPINISAKNILEFQEPQNKNETKPNIIEKNQIMSNNETNNKISNKKNFSLMNFGNSTMFSNMKSNIENSEKEDKEAEKKIYSSSYFKNINLNFLYSINKNSLLFDRCFIFSEENKNNKSEKIFNEENKNLNESTEKNCESKNGFFFNNTKRNPEKYSNNYKSSHSIDNKPVEHSTEMIINPSADLKYFNFTKIKDLLYLMLNNNFSSYSIYYLYNPIIVFSVVKGNYDPILFMLILLTLIFIELDIYSISGILFGISIHLEFFPLAYSPAFLLYIYYKSHLQKETFNQKTKAASKNKRHSAAHRLFIKFSEFLITKIFLIILSIISSFLNLILFIVGTIFCFRSLKFFCFTAIAFASLHLFFYVSFDEFYLQNNFYYFLFSKEEKLNFSLFNYLSYFTRKAYFKKVVILIIYALQGVLILLSTLLLYKDINLNISISTIIYITFNKNIDYKHIAWIFILFVLNIPYIKNFKEKKTKYLFIFLIYLYLIISWNSNFKAIQYYSQNKFLSTWIINIILFLLNCFFISEICSDKANIKRFIQDTHIE